MKTPYFSRERILADPRLAPFWIVAQNSDDGSNLDRKISQVFLAVGVFTRQMMPNELKADGVTGEIIKGDRKMLDDIISSAAGNNCKTVYVVDRKKGIRIKMIHYLFALPDEKFVDVNFGGEFVENRHVVMNKR
jgi:hypothetical protein